MESPGNISKVNKVRSTIIEISTIIKLNAKRKLDIDVCFAIVVTKQLNSMFSDFKLRYFNANLCNKRKKNC